jgi:hypothetical protein
MRGAMPTTVEEFREQVPLTTYADYLPELGEKREDVLPAKVARWVRTSGHTGEYAIKWVPMSEDFAREFEKVSGAFTLLAFCDGRGDVSHIKEHLKVLYAMGTPDYVTGFGGYLAQQAVNFDLLPANGDEMPFQERIETGFEQALYQGLDGFGGLSSVLVAVGEQIKQQSGKTSIRPLLGHPAALFRLSRGLIRSKLAHRPILPKDIWHIKAILGGGTDNTIFGKRVQEAWGRYPLEMYGSSEGGIYAIQLWDYGNMTFIPNLDFFEFIPMEEYIKWQFDHSYQPKTVLLDEVKADENYELVITNFHGGAMVRFRIGDIIKITSLCNEKLNIDIPQMVFHSRADDLIDLGLMRLTEKLIWQAIDNTGIPYADWTARKEIIDDKPALHIYLEVKDNYITSEEIAAAAIYEQIKKIGGSSIHQDMGTIESTIGLKPIEVTLLPQGVFSSYISQRQAEGADLGHLKPPHINPPDKVLSLLGTPEVVTKVVPSKKAERVLTQ